MKRLVLFAAAVLLLAPVAFGQQRSTYSLAREAYQDRLSQSLRQLRQEVDRAAQNAPQAAQHRFAPIYDQIAIADGKLAVLKTTSNLRLESARDEAEQAISKAYRLWSDFHLAEPRSETAQSDLAEP